MNILKELEAIGALDNWQHRNALSDKLSKLTLADLEVGIASRLKNKAFLNNIVSMVYHSNGCPLLRDISEALVQKIYSVAKRDEDDMIRQFLNFKNISVNLLETIIDRCAEKIANGEGNNYYVAGTLIGHANFTKALEDKLVASPKKYSFLYDELALKSVDENNIVKMVKYIKNSWNLRKIVKKGCLGHANLEKLAKIVPEVVAMHSRKLTAEFVDTLATSKNKDTVASSIMNVNMRPETMRRLLEEADPVKDYCLIRNVAYNKKATVENLAIAFSKSGTGFYNLKDFIKRADLMTYIQEKLKDSK